jgi:DNA repair protein RecO (recombination protein O)
VLRRRDFGEADRLLTMLTDRYGKIRVIAKGTRRTRSRLGGHLEPYARTNVLVARGRNLDIVTQAQVVASMPRLRSNESSIAYAAHWAELADLLMVEQQENRAAYLALVRALTSLEHGRDQQLTSRIYELELLTAAGFRPELFYCTSCGAPIEPGANGISLEAGGVVCPRCHAAEPRSVDISNSALRVLRAISRGEGERLHDRAMSIELQAEIEQIVIDYLRSVLERDLHAYRVLKRLDLAT